MKNVLLFTSIAAICAAVGVYYVSNEKLEQQDLRLATLERKVAEVEGRVYFQDAHSVANQQLQNPPTNIPSTTISFDKMEHNFGTIKQGDKVKTKFKFTNTGNENLVIVNAIGSCGCTVPSYPREPLAPGKSAELDVEFDSNGKEGEQSKTITVEANTEPKQTVLTIKSNILTSKSTK